MIHAVPPAARTAFFPAAAAGQREQEQIICRKPYGFLILISLRTSIRDFPNLRRLERLSDPRARGRAAHRVPPSC